MATSSVVVGSPPYRRWRPIVRPEDLQAPGTVIQSHFDVPAIDLDDFVSGAAADLRRLWSWAPRAVLCASVAGIGDAEMVLVRRRLREVGVRLVSNRPMPTAELRDAAGRLGVSPEDLARWLVHYLQPKGIQELGTVRSLAVTAAGEPIEPAVKKQQQRWAAQLGLPPWRRWHALGRALPALVALQGDLHVAVERVAHEHGYPEASGLSHACRRLFGAPPSTVRQWIGWEGLLAAFLRGA